MKFLKRKIFIFLLIFCMVAAGFVSARNMDNIKSSGVIKLATNAEYDPFEFKDGNDFAGIDIDISRKIAEKLGVKLEITDVAFDALVLEIQNGKCDFIAAAMSKTEEKAKTIDFSEPYYSSKMIVLAKENSEIKIEDIKNKKIGVGLGFSGDVYCTQNYPHTEILRYTKTADAVLDLKNGRVDVVVTDFAPAQKFINTLSGIKILDGELFKEDYRIAVKKGDLELLNYINNALIEMKNNGEINKIINKNIKYPENIKSGLWEQIKQNLIEKERYKTILKGLGVTMLITSVSLIVGISLGGLIALIRTSRNHNFIIFILKKISEFYVNIIRGTPVVVQLFVIYYMILSQSGMNKILIAMIAFGLNSAAYVSEILRAGINSIDVGQYEAARSLGLGSKLTMSKIILPQAFKNSLPTLISEFITLVKETSVAGFIGVEDLTKAGNMIYSQTLQANVPFLTVAAAYLAVTFTITYIMQMFERRLSVHDRN